MNTLCCHKRHADSGVNFEINRICVKLDCKLLSLSCDECLSLYHSNHLLHTLDKEEI